MKKNLLLATFLMFALAGQSQINFIEQPEWNTVLAKAKAEHKFIFVDAYTNWCSWCKVQDKTTFKDSAVISYMNKNFVCVKMEMETPGFGCRLAMKYHVKAFPTNLVLSPDGKFIERMIGYSKPPVFLPALTKIVATPAVQYPSGFGDSLQPTYPDFYAKSFIKNKDNKFEFADSATISDYLSAQKDLGAEVPFSVLTISGRAMYHFSGYILSYTEHLKNLYGAAEVESMVNKVLYDMFADISARKAESELQSTLFPMIDKHLTDYKDFQKAFFKMKFYEAQKNYAKEAQALNDFSLLPDPQQENGSTINEVSWMLYEKCDDPKALQTAADVMKKVTDATPEWALLDTYASLLYKLKDYSNAEAAANKGIANGLVAKEDVSPTQKLLEKIKAAKKGR